MSKCQFCGAGPDDEYMMRTWKCETTQDSQGIYQSRKCLMAELSQVVVRLREAERLLQDWVECADRSQLHTLVSCKETEDFLNEGVIAK